MQTGPPNRSTKFATSKPDQTNDGLDHLSDIGGDGANALDDASG